MVETLILKCPPTSKYGGGGFICYVIKDRYVNQGKLYHYHREDGPAVIRGNGSVEWGLYGKGYTFERWCQKLGKTEEEIVQLEEEVALLKLQCGDITLQPGDTMFGEMPNE